MIVQRFYDLILYKYKSDTFSDLKLRGLEDTILSDSELLFNNGVFKKYYDEAEKLIPTKSINNDLRNLLKENYAIQRIQSQKTDHPNWMDAGAVDFWSKTFHDILIAKKAVLSKIIKKIIQNPTEYIKQYQLTNNAILKQTNSNVDTTQKDTGITIDSFNTSVNELNNSCNITLGAKILKELNIPVEENDVIEVLETQWNAGQKPVQRSIFFGFVVSVVDSISYGEIDSRRVSCFGLSKMLNLSRVLDETSMAVGALYDEGFEIDKAPTSVFGTNFQDKTVDTVFGDIITKVLRLTGNKQSQSTSQAKAAEGKNTATAAYVCISELNNLISTTVAGALPGYEPAIAKKMLDITEKVWYDGLSADNKLAVNQYYFGSGTTTAPENGTILAYLQPLKSKTITVPANESNVRKTTDATVIELQAISVDGVQYKSRYDTKNYEERNALAALYNAYAQNITAILSSVQKNVDILTRQYSKVAAGTDPYTVDYTFPYGSDDVKTEKQLDNYINTLMPSFQVSAPLLLLYYLSRQVISNHTDTATLDAEPAPDIIAQYQGAGEYNYQAFKTMIRTAWQYYYSVLTLPDSVLNELRNNAFYEVFEDRPGIIRCRPPRYNLWFGDEIAYEDILSYEKTSNDAQLSSRADYKFFFKYSGVQEFLGGRWVDIDTLLKYGFRADAPKDNPNVTNPVLGNFWSALDLSKTNSETRSITISVPTTIDVKVGALYYIPLKESSDIGTANTNSCNVISSGLVGYVKSVSTSIVFGDVATHSVELIYIRKAEKFLDYTTGNESGVARLNFYKLPDLETFMQLLEKDPDLAKPAEIVSETAAKDEALQFGGVYWAVSPNVYDRFSRAIKEGITDQKFIDLQNSINLLSYACPTSFKPEHFKNKKTNQYPVVLQEMINRLWLFDTSITNNLSRRSDTYSIIHLPTYNKDKSIQDERITSMTETQKVQMSLPAQYQYTKTDEIAGPCAFLDMRCSHNAEYLEFNDPSSFTSPLTKSELAQWIEDYFITGYGTISGHAVKIGTSEYTLTAPYTGTPDGCANKSMYYDATINSINSPAPIAIGLNSIPVSKRLMIQNIANCGGLIGHKSFSSSTDEATLAKDEATADPVKYDHFLGLQVDVVPSVLQYWTLNETNSVLAAHRVSRTIRDNAQDILFTDASVSDSHYIKFTLDTAKLSSLISSTNIASLALELEFTKSTTGFLAADNALLPRLDGSYTPYDINGNHEAYHIKIARTSAEIPLDTTAVTLNKKVYFSIKYKDSVPATDIDQTGLPLYKMAKKYFNEKVTSTSVALTTLGATFIDLLNLSTGINKSILAIPNVVRDFFTKNKLATSASEDKCFDEERNKQQVLTTAQVLSMRTDTDISEALIENVYFQLKDVKAK